MKKIVIIIMTLFIGLVVVINNMDVSSVNAETAQTNDNTPKVANKFSYTSTLNKWQEQGLSDDLNITEIIAPNEFQFNQGVVISDTNGYSSFLDENSLENKNSNYIYDFSSAEEMTFVIDVDYEGLYSIALDYFSVNKTIRDLEIELSINDEIQYFEAGQLTLKNNWESSHDFNVDRYGNDIMPSSTIKEMWVHSYLRDAQRIQPDNLKFHLVSGVNTVKVKKIRGEFLLGQFYFESVDNKVSYDAYLKKHESATINKKDIVQIEAENPAYKNDLSVRYGSDKTSSVTPFALMENKLNILDGGSYRVSGHSVTYNLNIENDGFFFVTLKTKQNKSNSRVFRRLYVNGQVPFEEANTLAFDYQSKWRNTPLKTANNQEVMVYLKKGVNEITLESNGSPFKNIYESVDYVMNEVNELGLNIKKLTGNNSSSSTDWEIDKYIPTIKEDLNSYAQLLEDAYEDLMIINNTTKNSEISINIKRSAESLRYFANEPNKIPKEMNKFSVGNNSILQKLGLILPLILDQPLSIDKIYVHGENTKLPKATFNIFKNFWIGVKRFFLSFFSEQYSDKVKDDEVEVWVNRSRQYINLMQQMVDESFTKETGIKVKISIMPNEDKLILATSSKTQPDLALGIAGWRPYDFAIRNAVVDLSTMDDFYEVATRFKDGAFAQLIYQDGVYALPETQNFSVLFYRKDIMNNIGVEIPNTWQDVLDILPEIQRYGLNFYSPLSGSSAFKGYINTMPFINQFGGRLYSDDLLKSNLTDPNTIEAIDFMTELYTIYSLPLEVGSFYNSFRYGTLPIGIGDFAMYVQLLHAAPEIAGLWDVAPMPGVLKENGEVDRTYEGAATSGMVFKNTGKEKEAWELLKWWTSKEVQLEYSQNLMTSMGTEYMWNTSNVEAFKEASWDDSHKEVFLEQWDWIFDTPKTPASYMMERELSNIWSKIVYDGINTRIAISDSSIIIDKEINKKMMEFGYIDNRGQILKPYRFPTKETIHEWVRKR